MHILQDKVSARAICDTQSLKRAYRKLARNIHPDVLDAANATALFTELQTDYQKASALLESIAQARGTRAHSTQSGTAPTDANTPPQTASHDTHDTDAAFAADATDREHHGDAHTFTTHSRNAAQSHKSRKSRAPQNDTPKPFDFLVYKDSMASISSATMTALRKQTDFCQKTCARLIKEVSKIDAPSAKAFYTVFCAHKLAHVNADFGEPFMSALCEYVDILQTGSRYTPYQVQTYKRISESYFATALQKLGHDESELQEAIRTMTAFMWKIIE